MSDERVNMSPDLEATYPELRPLWEARRERDAWCKIATDLYRAVEILLHDLPRNDAIQPAIDAYEDAEARYREARNQGEPT